MTREEQLLMEQYIYQVVRRLPKDQRDEVSMELRELIGDMREQADLMEEVLTELGNPAEFAKRYRDDARCLIGPEYYDTYPWFVKVVLLCVVLSVLVSSVLEGVREGTAGFDGNAVETAVRMVVLSLGKAISNCLISCAGAFGSVTLIFAVMERQKVKFDLRQETEWSIRDLDGQPLGRSKPWSPELLAPVPHKKAVISRGDSIVSIVFLVIFSVLLIFAPQLFAAFFVEDGAVVTIPVFHLEKWNVILPVFAVSLLIGLADEILRLIAGVYCRVVMVSSIVCGTLQILLSVIVLKVLPFWNPAFWDEVRTRMEHRGQPLSFFAGWDTDVASNVLLAVIIAATLAEIGTTVYKTLRYGEKRQGFPG